MEDDKVQDIAINFARYAERLDNFISMQVEVNKHQLAIQEKFDDRLNKLETWKSKISGGRTVLIFLGTLVIQAIVVISSVYSIVQRDQTPPTSPVIERISENQIP